MNRLESNTVLEVLGINNRISSIEGKSDVLEDVYLWNDFTIYFYGSDYTIVRGKVPLEVAQRIYEKYPENPYGIRVEGGANSNIPLEWATSEEYENFINESLNELKPDFDKLEKVIFARRTEIFQNNPQSLYIGTYHVDTKEGLLILLTELHDHIASKQLNGEVLDSQVDKNAELLAEIIRRLIKRSNPCKDTGRWIKENNSILLKKTSNRKTADKQEKLIRELLNKFDSTVNPFINHEVEMLDPISYIDKVTIQLNAYDDGTARLNIRDNQSDSWIEHNRNSEYISYGITYPEQPSITVNIHHYLGVRKGSKEPENVICIDHIYPKFDDERSVDLRYNLIDGLAGTTYGDKSPVTKEQKSLIIKELQKAIAKAENLTINNMAAKKTV